MHKLLLRRHPQQHAALRLHRLLLGRLLELLPQLVDLSLLLTSEGREEEEQEQEGEADDEWRREEGVREGEPEGAECR